MEELRAHYTTNIVTKVSQDRGEDDLMSWYEAMADAWGKTLNQQAEKVTDLAKQIGNGADDPASVTMLSAESMKMQFLSNNAANATSSVGKALETLARKQ